MCFKNRVIYCFKRYLEFRYEDDFLPASLPSLSNQDRHHICLSEKRMFAVLFLISNRLFFKTWTSLLPFSPLSSLSIYPTPLRLKLRTPFMIFSLKTKVQLILGIFTFLTKRMKKKGTVNLIQSAQCLFHLDYSKALLFSLIHKFSPQASSTKQLLQI